MQKNNESPEVKVLPDRENEFQMLDKPEGGDTSTAMMTTRQAQEVQAAMIIAKKFPRDEAQAYDRIMRACKRKGLAETAEYTYPRGSTKVNGVTIRLAETAARGWGNVDFGIIEIDQKPGYSEMLAYAWDLETNVRVTKIFTVRHVREKRSGNEALTDPRDIYEASANFGARRLRACILGIIPGDVIDAAREECRKTLKGAYKEPLEDRFRKIVTVFESEYQVSQKQIEDYLGYNLKEVNENDYIRMQGVYRSLRDGMATVQAFFKRVEPAKTVGDPGFTAQPQTAAPAQTASPAPQQQAPAAVQTAPAASTVTQQSPDSDDLSQEEKDEIIAEEKRRATEEGKTRK